MYVDTENTVDQSDQFELKTDRAYIYLIVGKPGSGKTHCLKSIMLDYARQKHFKFGICFTQNTMTSDLDFLPKKAIDDDFSDQKLEAYMKRLMTVRENNKSQALPPSFIIFEDMIGSNKLNLYSNTMNKFLILHRHLNISVFFLSQYLGGKSGSSTLLREVTNYAVLFNTKFANSKEFLWKSCGGLFAKAQDFYSLLDDATSEKHRSLLYDASQDTITDSYKYFKAPADIPEFKLVF